MQIAVSVTAVIMTSELSVVTINIKYSLYFLISPPPFLSIILLLLSPFCTLLSTYSVQADCLATMSTTITRVMAAALSHSPSPPSVPCISARKAHPVKARAHLMRSSWTRPLSPLPPTPHQAQMQTSTMPTTPAWLG